MLRVVLLGAMPSLAHECGSRCLESRPCASTPASGVSVCNVGRSPLLAQWHSVHVTSVSIVEQEAWRERECERNGGMYAVSAPTSVPIVTCVLCVCHV